MVFKLVIWFILYHFALGQDESCSSAKDGDRKFVVCNVGLWYHNFGFQTKYIDPYLCSHISLSYLELTGDDFSIAMPGDNDREARWKMLREIVQLKRIKPSLQVLVSIGGWVDLTGKEQKYYNLESTRLMESFTNNVVSLIRQEGLDGVDFVWNYLGRSKSVSLDVGMLAKISKSLCGKLQKYGYLCSITLSGAHKHNGNMDGNMQFFSDLRKIIRSADMVVIWTADLSPQTGLFHSDMLRAPAGSPSSVAENTVEHVIHFYTNQTLNLDKSDLRKLGMVIPMQTNGLSNSGTLNTEMELGSGTETIRQDHEHFNQISFTRICERLKLPVNHNDALVLKSFDGAPFAVSPNGRNYFPLNTRKYVKEKVRFAIDSGLGGIVVFQIGADDFLGRCEHLPLPLLSSINDEILKAQCSV